MQAASQQQQRQAQQKRLEYSRNENHFDLDAKEEERKRRLDERSYMNVVPQEYDYLSSSTPRTGYLAQAPVKVEATESQQSKQTTGQTRSDRPVRRQNNQRQQPPQEPERYVYQPLDLPSPELRSTKPSLMESSTAVSSDRQKEEEKNPFWDSLDQDMWVKDCHVQSCQYCQTDFSFTRRRHHCRKCGKIFCYECINKKNIAGLTAKICRACEDLYDQYSKNLQREMKMTLENQIELEKQQQMATDQMASVDFGNFNQQQWSRQTAQSQHGNNKAMNNDYMQRFFVSKELPANMSVAELSSGISNNQAYNMKGAAGGFQMNGDKSMAQINNLGNSEHQSMQTAPNYQQNKLDYMDERFNNDEQQQKDKLISDNFSEQLQDVHQPSMENQSMNQSQLPSDNNVPQLLTQYSKRHIQKVVAEQIFICDLDVDKWENMLTNFVLKAVEQVQPSSRMLNDGMDINKYIKVKIIDWKDNSKSHMVNGVVMTKSIASKRMQTSRLDPKILLLRDIGQDDQSQQVHFTDLAQKITVEGHSDKILEQRLTEISPDLIVVQKDISVKLLNLMRDRDITVVCNLSERKMQRLARITQTIVSPAIDVIDRNFTLGKCTVFRQEKVARQLQDQSAFIQSTHNQEQTLLYFEGRNPVLGCTICLSGPVSKERDELVKVKKALQNMLYLAKNIVLERSFLNQIQCKVPEPPMDMDEFDQEDELRSIRRSSKAQTNEQTLHDVLQRWEITDLYSPFLITNQLKNRTRLVYKKIKIVLKQKDEYIPSGPSAYDSNDIPQDLNDTIGEFLRENSDIPSRRETFSTNDNPNRPFMTAEGKLTINEKFVQTKLDKMCDQPRDFILQFSRQSSKKDSNTTERSDQTLGRYLEQLASTSKRKCDGESCGLEKYLHSQEIYHRDGQIQITIKPQHMTYQESSGVQTQGRQMQDHNSQATSGSHAMASQRASTKQSIQIYAQCKTCWRFSGRSYVTPQLYEYSKARFFEQFFYNDKLEISERAFECDHGKHPLRDYIIEFFVASCKIRFRYTQIDKYRIQQVNPKNFSSHLSLKLLVQERKDKLQQVIELALENFKLDQVELLKNHIQQTIQQYDMTNEVKFRGTNMSVFLNHFKKISKTLENMKIDFNLFQEEAVKELDGFKDELLHLMFLKRKILVTFLGYQRAIDETIKQLALVIVTAKRRAQVIEFQISQNENRAQSVATMIEGQEVSVTIASQSGAQPNCGMTSFQNTSMASMDESMTGVETGSQAKKMTVNTNNRLGLAGKADIVREEEEKEEEDASPMNRKKVDSEDDMASVKIDEYLDNDESEGSETSIRKMEGSFEKSRRGSMVSRRNRSSRQLVTQRSFASDMHHNQQTRALSTSVDEKVQSESGKNSKKFGKLQKQTTLQPVKQLSQNRQNDALGVGRRKLHDSNWKEDSAILDLSDEDETVKIFQRHCFIEELCTCELNDSLEQKSLQQTQNQKQIHHMNHYQQTSPIPRVSASVKVVPGQFTNMLSQMKNMDSKDFPQFPMTLENNHHLDSKGIDEEHARDTDKNFSNMMQNQLANTMRHGQVSDTEMAFSSQQQALLNQQSGVTLPTNQIRSLSPNQSVQNSQIAPSLRQIQRPKTYYCPMTGQVSLNHYCCIVSHIEPCYRKMQEEVTDMQILLQKAIYIPTEANISHLRQGILDQQHHHQSRVAPTSEFKETKFGAKDPITNVHSSKSGLDCIVRDTSQVDGFETIYVEKKPKETITIDDLEDSNRELFEKTNRQGANLRENYDFITIPKTQQTRTESPNSAQKEAAKGDNSARVNRISRQIRQPVHDKWLQLNWIRALAKKNYPSLPLGVDNISINVNPADFGSIIAYAMTSNIYLEGLAKLGYNELNVIMQKQLNKANHQNTYELLDKDDVLNHKYVDIEQIQNMMLQKNQNNIVIKFSTHSKDVSMMMQEGHNNTIHNHAERHFKTGYTEEANKAKKKPVELSDLQSMGRQSEYTQSLQGSVMAGHISKQSKKSKKPEMKTKKVLNDFHLKVLPKFPKEYLKYQSIAECVNELEEVQSDLCRTYFSLDQISAINQFLNRKPVNKKPHAIEKPKINLTSEEAAFIKVNSSHMVHNLDTLNNSAVHNVRESGNMSMAFDSNRLGGITNDQSMMHHLTPNVVQEDNSFFNLSHPDVSMDVPSAHQEPQGKMLMTSQGTAAFGIGPVDKLSQQPGKRHNRKQDNKSNEKDENILELEEGAIFGVKSPAQQIMVEQNQTTKFINEGLKIPKIDFEVNIQFPKRFQALRRYYCGKHLDFVLSICKTKTWNSTGGKASKGFFTSHDKKFVFKMVKKEEFEMFCNFSPSYFDYLKRSFFHKYPCCLAKILGAYEVKVSCQTNPELNSRTFIFVQENLNLGLKKEDEPNIVRFDLKGSEHNRLVTPPIGPDGLPERVVLLDNNFLYKMKARPVVLPFEDAQALHMCINNDIVFFQTNNIIDYSLLAVIDTKRKKIRFAILDYCQINNYKKQAEYTYKKIMNLGGLPTIVPSDTYRLRFMTFMTKHFMGVCTQLEKKKSQKMTKEQARQSIMASKEEIDKLVHQSQQFQALSNAAGAAESDRRTMQQNSQQLPKGTTMIDTRGAGVSPMMH